MKAFDLAQRRAPIDTGNLRYNAVSYVYKSDDEFVIFVDEDIAPYMPYTNEPWLSDRWKGAKNPNEKWWDKLTKEIADFVAMEVGGQTKKTR
jgi:hypothetical protein